MSDRSLLVRLGPLVLGVLLIAADQFTKALILAGIPVDTVGFAWGNDFLWLVHQKNTGVAFSMGAGLPEVVRKALFVGIPFVILIGLGVYIWRSRTVTSLQSWALGFILGGGLGNLVDRMFRPDGVVDFVSVRLYGFLGMERFATFNLADSAITCGGALIVLSLLLERKRK